MFTASSAGRKPTSEPRYMIAAIVTRGSERYLLPVPSSQLQGTGRGGLYRPSPSLVDHGATAPRRIFSGLQSREESLENPPFRLPSSPQMGRTQFTKISYPWFMRSGSPPSAPSGPTPRVGPASWTRAEAHSDHETLIVTFNSLVQYPLLYMRRNRYQY